MLIESPEGYFVYSILCNKCFYVVFVMDTVSSLGRFYCKYSASMFSSDAAFYIYSKF